MTTSSPALIAVDWGSTHFRAKLVVDGQVVASASGPDGIRNLAGRSCSEVLAEHCLAWSHTHPGIPVLISGMAGAREGWHEVPYVAAPCSIDALAAAVVRVPDALFGEVGIVPGVRCDDPDTPTTDVMRGEETQLAGLIPELPASGATVCLPGTHSKWAMVRDGRIESFRTWLTGEAYERLTRDSLISGDGTPADPSSAAFRLGVEQSALPGGCLHHLFLGRTHLLSGRIGAAEVRSFVSGVLVGHEIREAIRFAPDRPVHLVGDSAAGEATAAGLTVLGLPFVPARGDLHLAGILAIASRRV
jgi:2-dehydro-3-deoxygalactonokinase